MSDAAALPSRLRTSRGLGWTACPVRPAASPVEPATACQPWCLVHVCRMVWNPKRGSQVSEPPPECGRNGLGPPRPDNVAAGGLHLYVRVRRPPEPCLHLESGRGDLPDEPFE